MSVPVVGKASKFEQVSSDDHQMSLEVRGLIFSWGRGG